MGFAPISYPSVNSTTFQLRDARGNLVPATVFSRGETQTFPLIPTSPPAYDATYTATVQGGTSGIMPYGDVMASDNSWSFTTASAPLSAPTCPCTLWNASTAAGAMENDGSAVELGVRFRSDVSGYITGVRFYKYGSNTGTHIGNLWTDTGSRLATATFTGETTSGWQQVTFATPIAIAANTTYVASYHTDVGRYAASDGYFGAGFDNAPLHALANGVDGSNGVYRYGTSAFPNQTYNAANYWVDVLFATSVAGDAAPPTVTSVSPASGASGVKATATVNALFSEAMTPETINSGTVELRDASGTLVPATVVYNATTPTAILRPASALTDGKTYTATVKGGTAAFQVKDLAGNALAADYSWSFTVGIPSAAAINCPCTIWTDASSSVAGPGADGSPVELGVRFRADVSGFITGVRFYKYAANRGVHVGHLWSNSGALLATATFSAESTSGWQQVTFATPIPVTANTTYVASYHTTVGRYAISSRYFATGVDNAPLHALRDGFDGPSGVYRYGSASAFPTDTWNATNYWVDVVFATNTAVDQTPPTVASTAPLNRATAVATDAVVTATFSEVLDPATVGSQSVQLRDGSGTLVPTTVTYSAATGTAMLTTTAALANGATYTATVKGGAAGVKDPSGNAMAADYSWSFTTAAASTPPSPPGPCPCTIWPPSATPAVAETDPSAVELGVRFRSDTSGYITGLRYYKASANTGVHVGSLWSSAGVLLARATFVGESVAGWQQVNLVPPVAVAPNATYIASYHSDNGHYAINSNYFTSGVDSAPLHALRDGVDGPSGVYAYGAAPAFPTQTYRSANYWVDVVFDTTAAADAVRPTVYSVTPSAGATGITATRVVTATFSEMMAPASVTTATFELRDAAGTLVPSSVVAGGETPTVTLTPAAPLANATTYTATLKGGANGVRDLAGNSLAATYTWSFTTAAPPPTGPACPCSIWSDTALPAAVDSDTGAVELGVKFQSTVAGYITALRFYKFSANSGPHVGELWTTTGMRIATVAFTNETASGWQQMALPTPVAIAANTTYVAAYHTTVGHYATSGRYFVNAGISQPPLRALRNGEDGGNGVYKYGAAGSFPDQTYDSDNYWVDVVFTTSPPDTTAPMVTSVTPAPGAANVSTTTLIAATFSEAMDPATITTATIELRDGAGALVPGVVAFNAPTRVATLTTRNALSATATYTVMVKGGAAEPRAKDMAGNPLAANATWMFTTAAASRPTDGPGGPILLVTSAANPFTGYYAEILRAEGLNEFAVRDLDTVTAATLSAYDVVLLGEAPLTSAQALMFTTWANGGGNLIAMRPDKKLAPLLGLTDSASTLADAYLRVDTDAAPGAGIAGTAMQFHGAADLYALSGATSVADLYAAPAATTPNPAVTIKPAIGANGGYAAAFMYDLARSIAYTRQGNPAWAGQERDGSAPIRPNDLFTGGGGAANWADLDALAVPQADEQQRLLANLIIHMNRVRKPLPRFWYFPRGAKAVVMMTAEDGANGMTAARFDSLMAASPAGCSVADWTCARGTSYVGANAAMTDASAARYAAAGFEIAPQVTTGCRDWIPASLDAQYTEQVTAFAARFPALAAPSTHRVQCSAWSDLATQPRVEAAHGLRLDASYAYWPDTWLMNRPGFVTGSGMPMRFVDERGAMIDVFQTAAQMTDQSGQSYPFTATALLDNAVGAAGYFAVLTASITSDTLYSFEADQIVQAAISRGVPVIGARQLLDWLDARNGSSFREITWNGNTLSFSVAQGLRASGLQGMLPTAAGATLTGITVNGSAVAFTRQRIKGVDYAIFEVTAGTYQASYTP